MKKVYSRPRSLKKVTYHYCPGCGHSIVHRLLCEVFDEMSIQDMVIGIPPPGCSVFTYNYLYRHTLSRGFGHLATPGVDGPWEPRYLLGTVPVRDDGSALFHVPANTPITLPAEMVNASLASTVPLPQRLYMAKLLFARMMARSVPTATWPGMPKMMMRAGVIRNPPPTPKMPVSRPTVSPMIPAINEAKPRNMSDQTGPVTVRIHERRGLKPACL